MTIYKHTVIYNIYDFQKRLASETNDLIISENFKEFVFNNRNYNNKNFKPQYIHVVFNLSKNLEELEKFISENKGCDSNIYGSLLDLSLELYSLNNYGIIKNIIYHFLPFMNLKKDFNIKDVADTLLKMEKQNIFIHKQSEDHLIVNAEKNADSFKLFTLKFNYDPFVLKIGDKFNFFNIEENTIESFYITKISYNFDNNLFCKLTYEVSNNKNGVDLKNFFIRFNSETSNFEITYLDYHLNKKYHINSTIFSCYQNEVLNYKIKNYKNIG